MSDLAERMAERAERAGVVMAEQRPAPPDPLIVRLDRVRQALDEVRTLADVGAVLEDVERLKRYAAAAKWTLDQQNAIARVWFLAQRRGGVLWRAAPKNPGVQTLGGTKMAPPNDIPTLAELGMTKRQASHWLYYSKIEEPAFERILDDIAETRRLTTSGLLAYLGLGARSGGTSARPDGTGDGSAIVYEADYRALLDQVPDASVDVLLTDPPYSTDVEDIIAFAAAWLPAALEKVRSDGRAYICIGPYPVELRAYLNVLAFERRLPIEQVLVWTYRNTIGPAPTHDYKLNWQAVLYLRGGSAPPLDCPLLTEQFSVMDVNAPGGAARPRLHAWQKPDALAERLVRHAVPEGGSILDPFAGTGTFLAAASRLGRQAIGAELDPDMLAWCEEREIEVIRADG